MKSVPRRRCRYEGEAGHSTALLGAVVGDPRRRGHRVLRPADADLDRPARRRLAGGVPLAPFARHDLEQARVKRLLAVRRNAISARAGPGGDDLSLIHISEPTRRTPISYAVFCL